MPQQPLVFALSLLISHSPSINWTLTFAVGAVKGQARPDGTFLSFKGDTLLCSFNRKKKIRNQWILL